MAGEVGGFTPEHEVHGSKRSRIRRIILCVTFFTLVGLAVVVAFAVTYASDPPGLIVHPGEVILLEGRFSEKSGKQYNVNALNTFADEHDNMPENSHLRHCSSNSKRESGSECIFRLEWVYDLCSKTDEWGYRNGKPCIFLTFNEPKDWVPEPYTSSSELPWEMPESLRNHIQEAFENDLPTEFLWVSCTGETPADIEFMGQAELSPWQGFPIYYFPVRQDSNPHAIPVLALKLTNAEYGVLINIRCHFWAKNLQLTPHIAARIELLK